MPFLELIQFWPNTTANTSSWVTQSLLADTASFLLCGPCTTPLEQCRIIILFSLPYSINRREWFEREDGFKVQGALQGTLDPIQTQAKKTFVNSVFAINQADVL